MKKITLALLGGLAATSLAKAEEALPSFASNPCSFAGFYTGLGLGYEFGKAQAKDDQEATDKLSPSGFAGGLFLGYGMDVSKVYLGLEFGYYLSTAKDSDEVMFGGTANKYEVKMKDRFELAARLGYSVGRWMPYFKIGYAWAKGTIKNKDTGDTLFNKRADGMQYGLGVDYKLTAKWSMGLGYTYSDLKQRFIYNDSACKASLKNNAIHLRGVYHF